MTFNFELARVISNKHCGGKCIKDAVEKEYKDLPKGAWPNFVVSRHATLAMVMQTLDTCCT